MKRKSSLSISIRNPTRVLADATGSVARACGSRATLNLQVFDDALQGRERFVFEEALVKGVVTWTGFTDLPRLDVPAAVELLRVEDKIHELRASVIYQILDLAWDPLQTVRLCPAGLSTEPLQRDKNRDFCCR